MLQPRPIQHSRGITCIFDRQNTTIHSDSDRIIQCPFVTHHLQPSTKNALEHAMADLHKPYLTYRLIVTQPAMSVKFGNSSCGENLHHTNAHSNSNHMSWVVRTRLHIHFNTRLICPVPIGKTRQYEFKRPTGFVTATEGHNSQATKCRRPLGAYALFYLESVKHLSVQCFAKGAHEPAIL